MLRAWQRDDRVIYAADPMLFGVMRVVQVRERDGLVVCRVDNAPAPASFEHFVPLSLLDAAELAGVPG